MRIIDRHAYIVSPSNLNVMVEQMFTTELYILPQGVYVT